MSADKIIAHFRARRTVLFIYITIISRVTGDQISSPDAENNILVLAEVVCLFQIWRAFMVSNARLLILLPLETSQVAPDGTVVLALALGDQT